MIGKILKISVATVVGLTVHNVMPLIVRAFELEKLVEDNPEMFVGSRASAIIEEMIEEMRRLGELPDLLAETWGQDGADLTDNLGDSGSDSRGSGNTL